MGHIIISISLIGYILNFQNIWQYWPAGGFSGDVPMRLAVSIAGIFIPPIGVVTGFIW